MAKISRSKKQNAPNSPGRAFLQERVYTDFHFFVKRNLQLFLFFLELVSFQEHSCRIPQLISLARLLRPGRTPRNLEGGPHAALSESSELHAGSLGAARR